MGNTMVVHCTQGSTIAGAVAAMRKHKSECHEVVDITTVAWTSKLLIPWDRPARSLKHPRGTPQTNNRGWTTGTAHLGKVYQVEVVGFAEQMATQPEAWFRVFGSYLGPLCDRLGVPRRFPCEFVPTDSAYGVNARQRLSWDEWERVDGIVGHQHVPGNAHWDPGGIGRVIPYVLAAARPPVPSLPPPVLPTVPALALLEVIDMPLPTEVKFTWSLLDLPDCQTITRELYRQAGNIDTDGMAYWDGQMVRLLEQGRDPRPLLAEISKQLREAATAGG